MKLSAISRALGAKYGVRMLSKSEEKRILNGFDDKQKQVIKKYYK